MANNIKSDIYRFGRSRVFYGVLLLTVIIAFLLSSLIRQDIRLGISVFGNLTALRGIDDIVRIGLLYNRGLGIFIAVLISVFIGQEYQWKTWQHKWIINKSRANIYLSKALLSSVASAAIFLVFQIVTFLGSRQSHELLTNEYIATIICGLFIYAALGAVICLLSMLIKNSTACAGYESIMTIEALDGSISITKSLRDSIGN